VGQNKQDGPVVVRSSAAAGEEGIRCRVLSSPCFLRTRCRVHENKAKEWFNLINWDEECPRTNFPVIEMTMEDSEITNPKFHYFYREMMLDRRSRRPGHPRERDYSHAN
jgi:hypothetical protein